MSTITIDDFTVGRVGALSMISPMDSTYGPLWTGPYVAQEEVKLGTQLEDKFF